MNFPKPAVKEITVGIADDQQLFLKSLGVMVNTFEGVSSVMDAANGKELLAKLERVEEKPDIVLLDVNMPIMDGVITAREISRHYPLIKLAALSMRDDDTTIINMLKAGCCAYLLKDIHPVELEKALIEIHTKGYYNGDAVNINYRRLILHEKKEEEVKLTDRELTFLQLACTDLKYVQIAAKMFLAERTIDGYRESLFEKFKVQSRVGMAMEAVRRGLIKL